MYSKKPLTRNSERDKLLREDSGKSEYESTRSIKGKEMLLIDPPAGFLEYFMQSIYHVSIWILCFIKILFTIVIVKKQIQYYARDLLQRRSLSNNGVWISLLN